MADAATAAGLRVIVTGGSGFIGTNLVEHYVRLGATVTNFDRQAPRNPQHRVYWTAGDLCDAVHLRTVVEQVRPQLVLHMAARTDLQGPTLDDYSANTSGVSNLLAILRDSPDVQRTIFCSSMLVCRLGYQPRHDTDYCPDSIYGASKVRGEELVRQAAPTHYSWAIVRPTSIWGPWFSVPYRNFFDAVRGGWYVHPRGRAVLRSYGFVGNAVHQIAAIAEAEPAATSGHTYYLADYEPLDVCDWANEVSAAFGRGRVRQIPLAALRVAARVGDALRVVGLRNPPLSGLRLRNLLTSAVYDMSQTIAVCPTLPFPRRTGVELTVEWLKSPNR